MAKLTLNTIGSRYGSIDALNDNFNAIEAAIENTLSLDGTSPNAMEVDLDMNNQDILNVGEVSAETLRINGVLVEPTTGVTAGAAFQTYEYTATAGQTSFSVAPATPYNASIVVIVNGLQLSPTEVSVSGTSVLTPALTVGDEVVIRRYTAEPLAAPDASEVNFIQAGTGAVTRTSQNKMRESISVIDFGADATGVADSTSAFALAFAGGGRVIIPTGSYKISTPITLVSNTEIVGYGLPTLTSSEAGKHIFSGASLSNVSVSGVAFVGTGSSTVPTVSVGGYAVTSSGLVTFVTCTNVSIENCTFNAFYNGISTNNCVGVNISRNRITNWLLYGVLASLSDRFSIDHNYIVGCNQTGAVGAYAVSATGDANGGNIQFANSISFNTIADIPSWDGIMTHDCDGLRIIGNDIRNVRNGLDLGSVNGTTTAKNVQVVSNYIEATTTDTWAGVAATHCAILFTGYSASVLSDTVVIANNIISGFYAMSGSPAFAGTSAHIGCTYANEINISGNIIKNGGTVSGAPAIAVVGNANIVAIDGNSVQGKFGSGGIRLASNIGSTCSITGNNIAQTLTTDIAVYITSSTVTSLEVSGNVTNSSVPYSETGSTITSKSVNAGHLHYTGTYSVTGLANGSATTLADFTVPGIVSGDAVTVMVPATGILVTGYCPGANLVRVTLFNATGSSLTVAGASIVIDANKYR